MRVEIPGGHRATEMAAWRCLHEARLLPLNLHPCGGQGLRSGSPFFTRPAPLFSALRAEGCEDGDCISNHNQTQTCLPTTPNNITGGTPNKQSTTPPNINRWSTTNNSAHNQHT